MLPKTAFVLLLLIAGVVAFGPPSSSTSAEGSTVEIDILSLAGWAGEVDPVSSDAGPVGGAAAIAAYWQNERAENPNTLALGTGNSFGTSPPISNLFADEPAINAMNEMGFDADTFGDGGFKHGIAYLQRLLNIADFPFISANLTNVDANLTGVRPYRIFDLAGVRVAVIGITDPYSMLTVFPGYFGSITVSEPYLAAYRAREQAQAEGAQVFVLITEMGVTGTAPPAGPLLDLAGKLQGFDVVLGNGSGANYSAVINGARVVAGMSRGQAYGRTTVTYDTDAQKVTGTEVAFVRPLVAKVTPDPSISAILDGYRKQLAAKLSAVIATSTVAVTAADACGNALGRTCESLTGNIVADAMRATYDADVAIINAGSMRAGLTCPVIGGAADFCPPYSGLPAPITAGQVQAILPFGNIAVTTTVSGAELKAMLENGVSTVLDAAGRFPQVSGICFWYDTGRMPGSRVLAAARQSTDGTCSGETIDFSSGARYQLVTNDFIAAGGDGYAKPSSAATFRDRLDTVAGDYLAQQKSVSPRIEGRINCVRLGCPALVSGAALPLPDGAPAGRDGATVRPPSTGDGGLIGS